MKSVTLIELKKMLKVKNIFITHHMIRVRDAVLVILMLIIILEKVSHQEKQLKILDYLENQK